MLFFYWVSKSLQVCNCMSHILVVSHIYQNRKGFWIHYKGVYSGGNITIIPLSNYSVSPQVTLVLFTLDWLPMSQGKCHIKRILTKNDLETTEK